MELTVLTLQAHCSQPRHLIGWLVFMPSQPIARFIATQLNSTSSCRHVHSVNNCHQSILNVVTQFVGHDVIYDVWNVDLYMSCYFAGIFYLPRINSFKMDVLGLKNWRTD